MTAPQAAATVGPSKLQLPPYVRAWNSALISVDVDIHFLYNCSIGNIVINHEYVYSHYSARCSPARLMCRRMLGWCQYCLWCTTAEERTWRRSMQRSRIHKVSQRNLHIYMRMRMHAYGDPRVTACAYVHIYVHIYAQY